jgi:thymidine kinase
MFSGKSSAALELINTFENNGANVLCITSNLDNRYTAEPAIMSHDKVSHPAVAVSTLMQLLETESFGNADAVVIDESQFFPDLKEFVLTAVDTCGKDVACFGLDGDANRKPFGQILDLVPYCDFVKKLKAKCSVCGLHDALFTHRIQQGIIEQIHVGGENTYMALCRVHYLEKN